MTQITQSLNLPHKKFADRVVDAPAATADKPAANGVLYCGDCIEIMTAMDENSVKVIVTSPPYNIKNSTGNGLKDGRGGKWKKAALNGVMIPTGTLWGMSVPSAGNANAYRR